MAPISAALTIVIVGAVTLSAGLVWMALAWLGVPGRSGQTVTVAEVLEVVKISLAVVAGTGGVVALVVAYRKQRITEVGEQREQAELYAERFDKAADKLGSESGAVRLAEFMRFLLWPTTGWGDGKCALTCCVPVCECSAGRSRTPPPRKA